MQLWLVLVACSDPKLQTPIQLSFIDIFLTITTIPQMLVHMLSVNRTISYNRCMIQLSSAVVSHCLCLRRTLTSWAVVSLSSLLYSVLVTRLISCGNQITHFFCDIAPLLKLSCTRLLVSEMLIFTEGVAIVVSPFFFILGSYARIGIAIVHMHSIAVLCKALSICSPHIPSSSYNLDQDRHVAIFYTVVTPMLHPLIYSLRNQEVKGALQRLFRKLKGTCLLRPKG
uniref:G-protein coupled receptors family 1 profile domain-containing protein n=1 Tax=Jaculus jaculus TaxID=51337 RepID=A0A8C5KEQ2_JACJA